MTPEQRRSLQYREAMLSFVVCGLGMFASALGCVFSDGWTSWACCVLSACYMAMGLLWGRRAENLQDQGATWRIPTVS